MARCVPPQTRFAMTIKAKTSWILLAALLSSPAGAAVTNIVIDDRNVFPESLSAAPDGTLYIGSELGRIYRARPGQDYAEPWLDPALSGLHKGLRGILVDGKTLWVCDEVGKESTLVHLDRVRGRRIASYDFPGGGHCNDIAIKNDDVFVTDTSNGRILKLAKRQAALTEWYKQDDRSLDGLAWARDGTLYTDTYSTHHLIRVDVNPDGSAGQGVILETSEPLFQPDGMRLAPDGRLLLAEGRGAPGAPLNEGRLDELRVHGKHAEIVVLKAGFELPTAVTATGKIAWVLESKFDYLRNPMVKGKDPGAFHVFAVPLRQ